MWGGEAKAESGGARSIAPLDERRRQQEAGEGAVGTQSQSKRHVGPEDANRVVWERGTGNCFPENSRREWGRGLGTHFDNLLPSFPAPPFLLPPA